MQQSWRKTQNIFPFDGNVGISFFAAFRRSQVRKLSKDIKIIKLTIKFFGDGLFACFLYLYLFHSIWEVSLSKIYITFSERTSVSLRSGIEINETKAIQKLSYTSSRIFLFYLSSLYLFESTTSSSNYLPWCSFYFAGMIFQNSWPIAQKIK